MNHGKLSFGPLFCSLLLAAALLACSASSNQNTAGPGGTGGTGGGETSSAGGGGTGGETGGAATGGSAGGGGHFAEWVRLFPYVDPPAGVPFYDPGTRRPVAVDADGNVYVGGDIHYWQDFGQGPVKCPTIASLGCSYVIKLDPSGKTLWQRFFAGELGDGQTQLTALAVAGGGVVIGLRWDQDFPDDLKPLDLGDGTTLDPKNQHSMVLARLAPEDGKVAWASAFGTKNIAQSDYFEAIPTAIVPDGDTGFVVAGQFSLPTLDLGLGPMLYFTLDTPFVAKFENDKPVWQISWQGDKAPPPSFDSYPEVQLKGAARLPGGQIAVMGAFKGSLTAGTSTITSEGRAGFLALLDGSGSVTWQEAVNVGGDTATGLQDVAADASGDILLTGVSSAATVTFGKDAGQPASEGQYLFLARIQPDGSPLWVKMQAGGEPQVSTAGDAAGNIGRGWQYVSEANPKFFGLSTIGKLNADGNELWSVSGAHYVPTNMTFDKEGHLIVTGWMGKTLELLPGGPVPADPGVFVARFAP
jgi:hypothetical protein